MRPLVLIEMPGVSRSMLERHAPRMASIGPVGSLTPEEPALTLPAHTSLVTGLPAHEHGVVANGWFERAQNQVTMWPQSERLAAGTPVWEKGRARDPDFTCLKWFWWPGMASSANAYGNVRPAYFADGRKGGDVYVSDPALNNLIRREHGPFPLHRFWGPATSVDSSQWIADSFRTLFDRTRPTLSLLYLPHLDYRQQTLGPDAPEIAVDVAELDAVVGPLVDHVRNTGAEVLLLSSYTMNPVSRPVCLNRILREAGWLRVTHNPTGELIDFGISQAFAVCDHQVAHVYLQGVDHEDARAKLQAVEGVARVEAGRHAREGDWVLYAEPDAWFAYPYWFDDSEAPDFARTVAIHAKPGYDPCEMLFDPALQAPKARVAAKLLAKKLGFRTLMDVIPLNPSLIKGSHGVRSTTGTDPILLDSATPERDEPVRVTEIAERALQHVFRGD